MRLLERLADASKLSLCVIRHVQRTGGRVLRWLVTISHTALVVLVVVFSARVSPDRVSSISLQLNSALSRLLATNVSHSLCSLLSLYLSLSYLQWCAFHMALCWFLPFSRLLTLSPSLSLSLSIVHNYTIRLLNRLMRPPLPAVATPFTETMRQAQASLLSLPPFLARVHEILKLLFTCACFFSLVCTLLHALIFLNENLFLAFYSLFEF